VPLSGLRTGGLYALVFRLRGVYSGPVGRRLYAALPPGLYLYVGTGWGPGGVAARLRRHMCGARRRLWWHIDYVASSPVYEPVAAVACLGAGRWLEPLFAALFASSRLFEPLGAGLGGSDDPMGFGHFFACIAGGVSACVGAAAGVAAGLPCLPRVVAGSPCRTGG